MPYELDAKSLKVLKKLSKGPLSEKDYKSLIGWMDGSQSNEIDSFLRKNHFVRYIIVDGISDGAGGYIDDTVVRQYEIMLDGRKAVEQNQSAGMAAAWGCLKDFLQTIFPFLPL